MKPHEVVFNQWLKNRHVLITGASSGIGKALAWRLAGQCSITDVNRMLTCVSTNRNGKLDQLKKEIEAHQKVKCFCYQADVCDTKKMEQIIDDAHQKQQIDAFIHCAGGSHIYAPLTDLSYDDIAKIVNVNLISTINWLKYLLPKMAMNEMTGKKRGHVVFLSSRSGERALANLCPYAAAKGGVEKLAEGLRTEYAKDRIAFTLINPGSARTAFVDDWKNSKAVEQHNQEAMRADDVAQMIRMCLDSDHVVNKLSLESIDQWLHEPGVQR